MDRLLDDIYDAGAMPDRWPALLDRLALLHGAKGGVLFHATVTDSAMIVSPRIEGFVDAYYGGGWMSPNVRGERMIAEHAPCFQTDTDFWSSRDMATMPLYKDFLIPSGFATGAGTAIQGTNHDMFGLTLEGMANDAVARRAIPRLNRLRPHLARAASLSIRLAREWSRTAVAALDLAGTPAAIISPDGRLRAANERFGTSMEGRATQIHGRLRFRDATVSARILTAGQRVLLDAKGAASIPIPSFGDGKACIMHMIPLRQAARTVFEGDGLLLIVADPDNRALPKAGTLRLLFDLTPAEAAVAGEVAMGYSLHEVAQRRGIRYSTVRTHLRSIFAKTNCHRQHDLVSLLGSLSQRQHLPG